MSSSFETQNLLYKILSKLAIRDQKYKERQESINKLDRIDYDQRRVTLGRAEQDVLEQTEHDSGRHGHEQEHAR